MGCAYALVVMNAAAEPFGSQGMYCFAVVLMRRLPAQRVRCMLLVHGEFRFASNSMPRYPRCSRSASMDCAHACSLQLAAPRCCSSPSHPMLPGYSRNCPATSKSCPGSTLIYKRDDRTVQYTTPRRGNKLLRARSPRAMPMSLARDPASRRNPCTSSPLMSPRLHLNPKCCGTEMATSSFGSCAHAACFFMSRSCARVACLMMSRRAHQRQPFHVHSLILMALFLRSHSVCGELWNSLSHTKKTQGALGVKRQP